MRYAVVIIPQASEWTEYVADSREEASRKKGWIECNFRNLKVKIVEEEDLPELEEIDDWAKVDKDDRCPKCGEYHLWNMWR